MIFGIFKTREEKARERAERIAEEAARVDEQEKEAKRELYRRLRGSLADYRLRADLAAVERRMEENRPVDTAQGNGFRKIWDQAVVNPQRRAALDRLSAEKQQILDRIAAYEKKCADEGISFAYAENEEELKAALDELFREDKSGVARAAFALLLFYEDGEEVCHPEEAAAALSRLLFGNEEKTAKLVRAFRDHLAYITRNPLPARPSAAALAFLAPVALPASEQDLARLAPEDYAVLLAARATLAAEARDALPAEEWKAILDEHLREADDLRADAEYLWIVEKTDAASAKAKVQATGRFVERLAAIAGI